MGSAGVARCCSGCGLTRLGRAFRAATAGACARTRRARADVGESHAIAGTDRRRPDLGLSGICAAGGTSAFLGFARTGVRARTRPASPVVGRPRGAGPGVGRPIGRTSRSFVESAPRGRIVGRSGGGSAGPCRR